MEEYKMGMLDKLLGKEITGGEITEDEYYSLGIDEAIKIQIVKEIK